MVEAWQREPLPDVELAILLCSCEETGLLGAKAWVQAHRRELTELPTTFLNLDTFGYGAPRIVGKEYDFAARPVRAPATVIEHALAAARERGLEDAGPHTLAVCGDGIPFLVRGTPD
jgi:Zn-dependent M28 family amino/carboxypeptidase